MSAFLGTPRPALSFGDLCSAEFILDSYLREDAGPLRDEVAKASFARKQWQVDRDLPYFVATDDKLRPRKDTDYLLAHGQRYEEAICLSDDCYVESALGRDGDGPSGDLLFAVVQPRQEGDKLEQNFRRFPLGDDRVVELHRTIRLATEDLVSGLEGGSISRRSVSDGVRDQLALRWSAHASRRGPFVAGSNAGKLVDGLTAAHGVDPDAANKAATDLVAVSTAAWRLEGRGLETAGQIVADNKLDVSKADVSGPVDEIEEDLLLLQQLTEASLESLRAAKP